MAAGLSEKQRREYRQAFNLFDTNGDDYIGADELQVVMRSLGHNPSNNEMRELISGGVSGMYTERGGKISFDMFCELMARKMKDADSESELKDAFRVLLGVGADAPGAGGEPKGFITVEEMRLICKGLDEDLEADEVYDMICEAISNFDGKIYYDGFVKIMIAK